MEREPDSLDRAAWTLYFDVDLTLTSARRERDAVDAIQDPGAVSWVVTLTGRE